MTQNLDNSAFDGLDLALPGVDADSGKRPKKERKPRVKKDKAPRVKKEKAPRAPRQRRAGKRSGNRRMFMIAAAIGVVAIGGSYIAMSSADKAPEGGYVIKATRDIRPGIAAPASAFEAVFIPVSALEPGSITGATAEQALARAAGDELSRDGLNVAVIGKRPLYPILENQTVRPEAFSGVEIAFARELASNERLVSISANAGSALAGSLMVGERVDVVVAFDATAAVLVEGAEIVGISADESAFRNAQQRQNSAEGSELSPGEILPTDPIPGVYTLIIDAEQVLPLVSADAQSGASIYLLGRGDRADSLRPADSLADYTCRIVDTAGVSDSAFCLEHRIEMARRASDLNQMVVNSADLTNS